MIIRKVFYAFTHNDIIWYVNMYVFMIDMCIQTFDMNTWYQKKTHENIDVFKQYLIE